MNLFETIKAAVPVRQAAEHYGLKVNRNGMACCPFHNDRHLNTRKKLFHFVLFHLYKKAQGSPPELFVF